MTTGGLEGICVSFEGVSYSPLRDLPGLSLYPFHVGTTETKREGESNSPGNRVLASSVWKVKGEMLWNCFLSFAVPGFFFAPLLLRSRLWAAPLPRSTLQQALEIELRLAKQFLYTRGPARGEEHIHWLSP